MSSSDNTLLNNRSHLTARQSMDSIINFAREQDHKIYVRAKRFAYGKALGAGLFLLPPFFYFFHSITVGYWRSIYPGGLLSTPFEARLTKMREYFVPEMYLKEREVRKIELGLKDTEELKGLFEKKEQA